MTKQHNPNSVQQNYANLAATYEKRWARFLSVTRDWVMDHVPSSPPPQSIFDFGCGTGVMLQKMRGRFPDAALTGLDISPAMLDIARENAPRASLLSDQNQITGAFDVVLSLNVLHHVPNAGAHLKYLKSRCTQGGTIILCDFALDSLPMNMAEIYWRITNKAHHKSFTPPTLAALIRQNGLHIKARTVLKPDHFWRLQIYKLMSV